MTPRSDPNMYPWIQGQCLLLQDLFPDATDNVWNIIAVQGDRLMRRSCKQYILEYTCTSAQLWLLAQVHLVLPGCGRLLISVWLYLNPIYAWACLRKNTDVCTASRGKGHLFGDVRLWRVGIGGLGSRPRLGCKEVEGRPAGLGRAGVSCLCWPLHSYITPQQLQSARFMLHSSITIWRASGWAWARWVPCLCWPLLQWWVIPQQTQTARFMSYEVPQQVVRRPAGPSTLGFFAFVDSCCYQTQSILP